MHNIYIHIYIYTYIIDLIDHIFGWIWWLQPVLANFLDIPSFLPGRDFCSWAAFCSAALFSTTTPAGEYPPRNRLSLVGSHINNVVSCDISGREVVADRGSNAQ